MRVEGAVAASGTVVHMNRVMSVHKIMSIHSYTRDRQKDREFCVDTTSVGLSHTHPNQYLRCHTVTRVDKSYSKTVLGEYPLWRMELLISIPHAVC